MADSDRVKQITDDLEVTFQNLRSAAANISGLLAVGQATCDEVQAYNLWALATYNAQRGMLATLRANGEQGVPELPPDPTLFAWQGVEGNDAVNIDCSGQPQSLSGAMARALAGPTPTTPTLSLDQIRIVTTDANVYEPEKSPSFSTLINLQNQQAGLGIAPVTLLIVIAGIAIGIAVAISALMAFLTENSIQEETTQRTRVQSDAFQKYTAARLQCYSSCTGQGQSISDCVSTCSKLIDKPNIKIDSARGTSSWGAVQWVGVVTLVSFGALVVYKVWQKKMRGESLLPSFHLLPEHT